jgi:small conductance mechanosensitive channel
MILEVFGVDTKSLVASLGVIGVVLGLALQDTLKDFLSGFNIIFENQFDVGDNVKIGTFRGEVISLGLKTTKVKAFTGEVLIVSNRNIIEVINYSMNNSLALIDILVSSSTKVSEVEKILEKLIKKLSKEIEGLISEITLVGVTNITANSIDLRLTVETEPLKNFEVERIIRREVKIELDKHGIDMPYQQMVVHNG